jgi:hypothetical protein
LDRIVPGRVERRKSVAGRPAQLDNRPMLIAFQRGRDGSCAARIDRPDKVVVELISGKGKWRTPHDLAHAATERELGLTDGVFGSIASGAVFKGMRLVSGRPRHDAAARSARVLHANARAISLAEMLTGVVHRAVEHGVATASLEWARRSWGILETRPFPWTAADLRRATDLLRELSRRWAVIGPDDRVELDWPERLVLPPPPAPRGRRPATRRR